MYVMSQTEAYIMPSKQELMLSMSTCESTQNKDVSGVSSSFLSLAANSWVVDAKWTLAAQNKP